MPVTIKNENEDVLGDALKKQEEARSYDPYQWQAAANGQGKNRVLMHGSGGDVVELVEAQPPVSRMIALPDTDAEALPVLVKFFAENTDLADTAVNAEVRKIRAEMGDKNPPGFGRSEIFNLAVVRLCKANGLPLEREASLPAPLKVPTLNDEIARLQGEAKKTRTDPGPEFSSVRQAVIAMTPKTKKR